jgi:hypothetical protein
MKWFTIFCYVVLILLGVMGLIDLIFFLLGGSGETLSYRFWELSKEWPLIPFILGFITGHLVWQYDPDSIKKNR